MSTALGELKNDPNIGYALAASSPTDFDDACNVTAKLYETITTKLPPERSSKVIRHIFSQIDPMDTDPSEFVKMR